MLNCLDSPFVSIELHKFVIYQTMSILIKLTEVQARHVGTIMSWGTTKNIRNIRRSQKLNKNFQSEKCQNMKSDINQNADIKQVQLHVVTSNNCKI